MPHHRQSIYGSKCNLLAPTVFSFSTSGCRFTIGHERTARPGPGTCDATNNHSAPEASKSIFSIPFFSEAGRPMETPVRVAVAGLGRMESSTPFTLMQLSQGNRGVALLPLCVTRFPDAPKWWPQRWAARSRPIALWKNSATPGLRTRRSLVRPQSQSASRLRRSLGLARAAGHRGEAPDGQPRDRS